MHYLPIDDPEVASLVEKEALRINNTLDMIASENHAPRSIMEAQGSIFTTKAAEGYPNRRFHSGCIYADELESLAISRAKALFGAEHANVQPHTGVSANLAVYFSVLNSGDNVLAMKLSHGGHLSHGHPSSITSRCFNFTHYGVNRETELLDYEEIRDLALKVRPRMIVSGASTYSRLIDYEKIAEIAQEVSAYTMVDMAHIAGLVAAGVIPSPVPSADFVTFTTYKTLRGGRGGVILCKAKYAQKIDGAIFPGSQGTPFANMVAAKAVCLKLAMNSEFIEIQKKTLENAACLVEAFHKRGYRVVYGGTDNHIVLLDLRPKGLTGDVAEKTLESVGILTNKNVIPYDSKKPTVGSGIRLGSSAISSRGMGKPEVRKIAELIDKALLKRNRKDILYRVAEDVADLCKKFPVYKNNLIEP
jgi:glycine hydroxymethyltransferase